MKSAIHQFFNPAIQLLNRYSFPRKFLIAGALVALPLLFLTSQFVAVLNDRVELAQEELVGNQAIRKMVRLWRTLRSERFVAIVAQKSEDSQSASKHVAFLDELRRQLQALMEPNSELGILSRSSRWIALRSKFQILIARSDEDEAALSEPEILSELIEDIETVIQQVADLSKQTIDQHLDSQNLAACSSRLLPQLIEFEDRLRDRIILGIDPLNPAERLNLEMAEANGAIGVLFEQIRQQIGLAMQHNSHARELLRRPIATTGDAIRALELEYRKRTTAFDEMPTLTEMEEMSFVLIRETLGLHKASLDAFDDVIEQRVQSARFWRTCLLLATLSPMLLAIYLIIGLCLAIIRTAEGMREVTNRILSDADSEPANLCVEAQDELGRMIEHFQRLAVRLREEWTLAHAEAAHASQAEESLRINQERFDLVLRGANDGIWDWDLQTDQVFYSDRFQELLGYDQGEFDVWLSALADVLHPDDFDNSWQAVERHLQDREPYHIEHRLRTKSGEYRWFLERGQAVWNEAGVPIRMAGSISDITHRKGTEARERVRNQVLELLAAGAPLAEVLDPLVRSVESESSRIRCSILFLDKERRRLLTGAAPGLPDWFNSVVHGMEIGVGVGSCGTAAVLGQRVVVEDIATHPYWEKGRELAARAGLASCWSEPIRGNSGTILGTFAIYGTHVGGPSESDIKLIEVAASLAGIAIERKQMDDALRESEERWKFALEGAGDGVWDWNIHSGEVLFSKRWAEMLGFTVDQLENSMEGWKSRIHPDDVGAVMSSLQDYLDGKTATYMHEHRMLGCDRREIWILSRGIAVSRDSSGQVRRMIGTHSDITDRKRIEQDSRRYLEQVEASRDRIADQSIQLIRQSEELEKARDLAEAAARAKSEFLANMSHELRTPLTAILGYADVMYDAMTAEKRDSQQLETVDIIRSNGVHLQELINDILDLSKIEAGRMTLERVIMSPIQMVEETLRLMQLRAREKGLSLQTEFLYPLPDKILTDALRVRQIMVNLIGNAIKFTELGNIKVTVRFVPRTATLIFSVADTGIGINPEQLRNLFMPFSQADASMTRRFGGTGLGLSISRRLAQMLGGDISAESTFGVGSRFTLNICVEICPDTIMLAKDPAAGSIVSMSTAATASTVRLEGRILLAEDVLANQKLIAFLLEKVGAEIHVVDNGKLAVDCAWHAQAHGAPFDLILMDLQMPEMDGHTATSVLRERGYTGRIIALTAHASDDDRERCLSSGFDGFAVKPIQKDQLFAACSEQLKIARAQATTPAP